MRAERERQPDKEGVYLVTWRIKLGYKIALAWRQNETPGNLVSASGVTIIPPMQSAITILASTLGGGLAGACVSVLFNRIFHWRALRTEFYPILSNMFSAYVIRMEKPEGRYWTNIVGNIPAAEDKEFIDHRASFTVDLVKYNELKEVRLLRTLMLNNAMSGDHKRGEKATLDLVPESAALNACMATLHKKLKL